MRVSIVIPTYNHLDDLLKPCLESIQKYTDLTDKEVIVSANGCTDGTKEYVESLGSAFKLVWNQEPLGYTKATNQGILAAQGEFIILLNNDTVLLDQDKDIWIDMLLEPFQDSKTGLTGPMLVHCPYADRDFLIFFCVAMRRSLFEQIGLLDEAFSPGFGEDTDFCTKAQELGYTLVQAPCRSNTYLQPKFMVGGFPIFHKGEGTFADWVNGNRLLAERRFILMNRYNKHIKLNLGSGKRPLPGYFNIDVAEECDIYWDARKLPLEDNTVDEIVAIHLLEHFKKQEVQDILKDWNRMLKLNGRLILEFPDVKGLFKRFETAENDERQFLLDCVFGANTPEFPHLYGWYGDIIWLALNQAGFSLIEQKPPQVEHWGINMRIECVKLPDGYFGTSDIQSYHNLINKVPDGGIIAELGCWKGKSLCSVAELIKKKNIKVVAVDTFKGSVNEEEHQLIVQREDIKSIFTDNMRLVGLNPQICEMTTHEASQLFEDNYFDLVFVDADHSYEACRKDLQDWWPKVKRGGVLSGHDCQWKNVADALTDEFGHLVLTDWNNVWWINKHKVYDCFPFCNELDQLEIRLNELDNEVDYFVLVEGTETHSGQPKPLHFAENKQRFEKWLPKIIHIVIDDWPPFVAGNSDSPWVRERMQRQAILQGLGNIGEYDVLILGDADEIASAKAVRNYKRHMGMCRLQMNLYYYYLNCQSMKNNGKWQESRIIPYQVFKEQHLDPCLARYTPVENLPTIPDAGWHFSFQGGVDEVIKKIQSYSHQEYNKPEIIDRKRVEQMLAEGKDVFGRWDMDYCTVPIDDSYPVYIKNNLDKFRHMIKI